MIIKATWRRSVRVQPYETEEFTLSVEGDYAIGAENLGKISSDGRELAKGEAAEVAEQLARELAFHGDGLVAERGQARCPANYPDDCGPRPARPSEPVEPDPFVG
jgi:hypothetical protein